jgi:hypothetical protein
MGDDGRYTGSRTESILKCLKFLNIEQVSKRKLWVLPWLRE